MTMPVERTRSAFQMRDFLRELSRSPQIPESFRAEAARLLRHYPEAQLLLHTGWLDEIIHSSEPGDPRRELAINEYPELLASAPMGDAEQHGHQRPQQCASQVPIWLLGAKAASFHTGIVVVFAHFYFPSNWPSPRGDIDRLRHTGRATEEQKKKNLVRRFPCDGRFSGLQIAELLPQ